MSLRARLRERLHEGLERLRQRLLQDELEEDPRHARGRRPGRAVSVTGGTLAPSGTEAPLPPPLCPPPTALEAVLPGTRWDVTAPLAASVEAARAAGREGLIVVVELSSCLHSERAIEALRAGATVWSGAWDLFRLRVGDRLSKAYLRELEIGDVRIVLTSLPLTLTFVLSPGGLRFQALALDPLGPSRDHRRLRALLAGMPQLAPGAEQETVRVWKQGHLIELGRLQGFSQPFEVRLEGRG